MHDASPISLTHRHDINPQAANAILPLLKVAFREVETRQTFSDRHRKLLHGNSGRLRHFSHR